MLFTLARSIIKAPWWVWPSGVGALILTIITFSGIHSSYQKEQTNDTTETPLDSPSISQISNGHGSPNIYAPNSTINLGPAKKDKRNAASPTITMQTYEGLTISATTGNPPTTKAQKYFKQHKLQLKNPNQFPIYSINLTLQLPEPIQQSTEHLYPPGVNVQWRPLRSVWTSTGNVQELGTPAPTTLWALGIDQLRPSEEITITFLTTIEPQDSFLALNSRYNSFQPQQPIGSSQISIPLPITDAYITSIRISPDRKSLISVDYITGSFQYESEGLTDSAEFITHLLYDPKNRTIAAEETEIPPGKYQTPVYRNG